MKPSRLRLDRAEPLEHRLALAGLFTFTDVDGDLVAVRTSRGTDAGLAASVWLVPNGAGRQLQMIVLLDPSFEGTDLSVAVRTRAAGGDGRVNLGELRTAAGLGTVTIRGDVGQIRVSGLTSNSIAKLTVGSLGALGTSTGAASNLSVVDGSVGSLKIEGNLDKASLVVGQRLEKAVIGGSIIGSNNGDGIGAGGIGSITVTRSVFGGAQPRSGQIFSTGAIGRVRIGGDVVGGGGESSGSIQSNNASAITECRIGGGVFGGSGRNSGSVYAGSEGFGSITIGSSVVGNDGDSSGSLLTPGEIRSGRIGGSVAGGAGSTSGFVGAIFGIRKLRVGGDVRGGLGSGSGAIWANNGLISQLNVRSIVTGGGPLSGSVNATLLGQVVVRGDLIGSTTRDATIRAKGSDWSSAPTIGSVRVLGNAYRANVLAGYDVMGPARGSVRIGTVSIAGTLSQSTIAAGVRNAGGVFQFGNGGDTAIAGGSSRIDVVAVGGRALGNGVVGESFGIVAGAIGRVRIASNRYAPVAGSFTYPSGDNFAIHVL